MERSRNSFSCAISLKFTANLADSPARPERLQEIGELVRAVSNLFAPNWSCPCPRPLVARDVLQAMQHRLVGGGHAVPVKLIRAAGRLELAVEEGDQGAGHRQDPDPVEVGSQLVIDRRR